MFFVILSKENKIIPVPFPLIKIKFSFNIFIYPILRCCKASFTPLSVFCSFWHLNFSSPKVISNLRSNLFMQLYFIFSHFGRNQSFFSFHTLHSLLFDLRVFASNSSDPSFFPHFQILSPSVII